MAWEYGHETPDAWDDNSGTVVEVIGDDLHVKAEEGAGYTMQSTRTSIPLDVIAEVMRRAGYTIAKT